METKTENLMASTWTKAALLRRSFNAGPKRKTDLVLDAEDAALEAYVAFRAFRNEAAKSGLDSAARLGLMLMDVKCTGKDKIVSVPTTLENIAGLFKELQRQTAGGDVVPLGLLYWLRDDDPKALKIPKGAYWEDEAPELQTSAVTWVKPWLVESPRARLVTEAARNAFETSGGEATPVRV